MTPIAVANPTSGHTWIPETDSEKAAVRVQLDRLLSSPLFRNSKRYPALLRYVVERVLDGHTDSIKERTLGIEVFHREPDYDTNQDPVVRTTAVEVRRRLVQYYQEPGREHEIRIEFHAGSYTPEIRMPAPVPVLVPQPAAPEVRRRNIPSLALACVLVLIAASAGVYWRSQASVSTALDRFWSPVWGSSDPVLVCVEESAAEQPSGAGQQVSFDNVTAVARILGQKPDRSKSFRIRSEANTKFEDLREGPVVLIGGFGNRWSMRLLDQLNLRFRLQRQGRAAWIGDRDNPAMKTWLVDLDGSSTGVKEDFALISRVRDPSTGQMAVIAAGLMHFGTSAAGEALSAPQYMEEVVRSAPGNWEAKNVQIVIATRLTGANSGPPRIVATYFW